MFLRIALLLLLSVIVGATAPLFSVFGQAISPRDLILIGGGVFLIWKSTQEIHQLLEGEEGHASTAVRATFSAIILQIIIIDIVFSLDSITVSYTHLDVYKRQARNHLHQALSAKSAFRERVEARLDTDDGDDQ